MCRVGSDVVVRAGVKGRLGEHNVQRFGRGWNRSTGSSFIYRELSTGELTGLRQALLSVFHKYAITITL